MDKLWRRIRNRKKISKSSSDKNATQNKSPEPDPEPESLGNTAKRFNIENVMPASEPREEDSLGKWMSGTTYEVDEEDGTTVILKILEDVLLSEVQSAIEELRNLGGQRDWDSQPDKDTSSSLIPSAQEDRHSQLDQFSQVNNDMYTRKPPDGVLEVSERVYVFDCCLTVDGSNNKDRTILIKGVVDKVRRHFPDAFLKVFNFGEQESQRQMSELLSYMDVMNYPIRHGNCPILTMEMIHLFLRSADAWLSCDEQRCMLLMHCERGGWPVLAFMLAALLLYWKKSNGEEETLHSIYKKDPLDLLHLISPLNPLPSQLRYLHYISTSNVDLKGRLPNKAVTLDSVILRFIPCLDAELGCHLMFKIFGQDPHNLTDKTPTVLFSTPWGKDIRHYKQADCELVKVDIHCPIQGDVVLECMSLDAGLEHGETMFRVMCNTAYLLENVLMLGLDQMDVPWDRQSRYSRDFRAGITFSEMNPVASLVSVDSSSNEEQKENGLAKGAKKIEAQELQVEDQAVYSALLSRDANTSHGENEVQEWPIQSDTAFPTSILLPTLYSQLEASVHSALDGSLASSDFASSSLPLDGSPISFNAMLTKRNVEPLQSSKQQLVSSLEPSQGVHSVLVDSLSGEEQTENQVTKRNKKIEAQELDQAVDSALLSQDAYTELHPKLMNKLWPRIGNRKSSSQSLRDRNATQNKLVLLGKPAKWFDLADVMRASKQGLGKGMFGTTNKADLKDGTITVVVKMLEDVVLSAEDFRDKVEALGAVDHENLLPLRGYFYSKDQKFLLYDYMPLGSLLDQLHGNRGLTPLDWELRLSIALETALAIEHLHAQCHPYIHHGNIKSSNILLTPSYEARLTHYGLAPLTRPASEGSDDPTMTDVNSFGVLLLELLTGKPLTQALLKEEGHGVDLPTWIQSIPRMDWTVDVFDLELMLYPDLEEGMVELLEVAMSCVSPNPRERPQMSGVRRKIEELSGLVPSAQVDRDSQLNLFREVNNDLYTWKPPDGISKVSERVYIFDCCLTVDGLNNEGHQIWIERVAVKVGQHFPDAFFKVFNFGEQENQSHLSVVLSHMPVMYYPIHHGDCPILTMEMIQLFLRSADAWLSCEEQRCMLLMHCERGGWPVLAFMLAALLLYWKKSNGEEETLHLIYKKAPPNILHLISPLNPLPSQLRYLHYISTSNVDSKGRLPDKAVTLDSVILRFVPYLDAEVGCHLMFKIFGQDPHNLTDKTPTVLFSTPERGKDIKHYKQADCKLVIVDIHCPIQGDVVLECKSLRAGLEHGETMFRVMFNTTFLWENVLILGLDQMDVPWDRQNQYSQDFRAEITFSEMNPAASLVSIDSSSDEEPKENQLAKGAKKIEAQELQVEDQTVYSASLSRDANTSHDDNEVREWPIQSNTAFPTSILEPKLSSQLEASVHSALDGSLASSDSASSSLSQDGSLVSFSATLTEKNIESLQSHKQHLVSSLELPQDVHSGENMESVRWEGIAAVTGTNMEVTLVGDLASSSAINNGSVEANAAGVSNLVQIPDLTLPKQEKVYQQEDSPSSTSMSSGYDYDVFLSFRGPDTRSGITNFLYTRLQGAKINTFKDDEELRVGEEFGPELLKAISQSKIAIPIFSTGYASSKWCLNELVQMVECSKTRRQKIMPIFYNITPAEVRHQTGSYEEAFLLHKEKFGANVSKWKAALNHVANLNGWDNSKKNRGEGELVDEIVKKVIDELKTAYLLVTDCLVEVENHVKEIDAMMCVDSEDIRILGIHGMGGVGKTTLAKIIYNRLLHHFEACCFLSNIRGTSELKGIEGLQNQLISDVLKKEWSNISNVEDGIKIIKERLYGKKVLLLLDDVDQMTHWDALIGKPAWFGLGSRIIITSRNRDIVNAPEFYYPYELMSMNSDQSLQLFCKHAFGRDYPLDDYVDFSIEVVESTGGLPLALEAIGKLLPRSSKGVWDVILRKLKQVPLYEVKQKLKRSYDALDDCQKHIFLEIACLFTGFDQKMMLHSWKKSNFFPEEGLEVLQRMSLIKIGEDNKLWMHDQLKGLGRDIVRRECGKERKKKTRLWNCAEGLEVVMEPKGTQKIEALCRKFDPQLLYNFANEEVENWPSNDKVYGDSTCLLLSKIGICVCQLGRQFFLPSL